MSAHYNTATRWADIMRGFGVGVVAASLLVAYAPSLAGRLQDVVTVSPPALAAAPVACAGDALTAADRVALEDTRALVETLRLPVTARATGTPPRPTRQSAAPARRDQIGESIAANR